MKRHVSPVMVVFALCFVLSPVAALAGSVGQGSDSPFVGAGVADQAASPPAGDTFSTPVGQHGGQIAPSPFPGMPSDPLPPPGSPSTPRKEETSTLALPSAHESPDDSKLVLVVALGISVFLNIYLISANIGMRRNSRRR